ncbi:MAG TPA: GrpB family protein [Anaerolineaceae bacterium]|nr:GrpB family protein [Anaerolineaceae bacterium]HPS32518.1 GrpB family protein [Anaerolineaceae bacterium]
MRTKQVVVVPWQPEWPARFEEIAAALLPALEGLICAVEHVGSTSVPGLAAKPIIDIDIIIPDLSAFPRVRGALAALGYRHEGDLGIPGREAFKYDGKPELMAHHLYVCTRDAAELRRHLALRDYLCAHPQDRERYAQVKLAAAARYPTDIDAYIEEKSAIIQEIYSRCGLEPEPEA